MELFRALGALAEFPGPAQQRLGEMLGLPGTADPADYTEVFVFQLYPYASVYAGADGMLGGDAQDRAAGFWRALNRVPPAEPDHLSVLLALYAALAEEEDAEADRARAALWRQGRTALLREHLASWLFPYLDRLDEIAPPFYRAWGALLGEAIAAELRSAEPNPQAQAADPDALPLHLRQAPPLPDPRDDGGPAFLQGLLSPVRSGIVLVRADLARAARDLGLGLRIGERRFVLEALLAQDPDRTLAWVGAEARASAARHLRHEPVVGDVARFWARRAERTAALLGALRVPA